jgi:biopolymer transport protein ExbD
VNPVVDTIMLVLFVLFMVYIFRGYHTNRLDTLEEEEKKHAQDKASREGGTGEDGG